MANGRRCGGTFTFFVCGEGLERYFSKEIEGDLIVWFRDECACSVVWMQGGVQVFNSCCSVEDCADMCHVQGNFVFLGLIVCPCSSLT